LFPKENPPNCSRSTKRSKIWQKIDPQKSKIVELRYFGGLSVEETAEVLGVSEITVKRHWRMAKAWLYGQLSQQNS